MAKVKKGDKVLINYIGKLDDGTIIDSTFEPAECNEMGSCSGGCSDDCAEEYGPLEITIGQEDFFSEVEEALIGMEPGQKVSVTIAANCAFGEYDPEAVITVERSQLPDDMTPEVGDDLVINNEDDDDLEVTVVEVTDETITFDANHPLAGEDIMYEVELLQII